jgi:hypothetical protein
MVTDVRNGYVNVQSATGVRLRQLEETNAFGRYDFGWSAEPWWVPQPAFQKVMDRNFPGCDLWSRRAIVEKVPAYSSWTSFWHAVTDTGSLFHIYTDGPLVVTTAISVTAGAERLKHQMADRTRIGNERGFLVRWSTE